MKEMIKEGSTISLQMEMRGKCTLEYVNLLQAPPGDMSIFSPSGEHNKFQQRFHAMKIVLIGL